MLNDQIMVGRLVELTYIKKKINDVCCLEEVTCRRLKNKY